MKKYKDSFFLALAVMMVIITSLSLTSCKDDSYEPQQPQILWHTSEMEAYTMPSPHEGGYYISNRWESNDYPFYYEYQNVIPLHIRGIEICEHSKEEKRNKFLSLCERYNDIVPPFQPISIDSVRNLTLNEYIQYETCQRRRFALGEEIQDIKICAIDDFDEQHPAGSSLNDVAIFQWESYYDYYINGHDYNALKGNGSYILPYAKDYKHIYHALISDKSIYPIKMVSNYVWHEPLICFLNEKQPAPGKYRMSVQLVFETCELNLKVVVAFTET